MINYAPIGEAVLHPTKKKILTAMHGKGAHGHNVYSPNELSKLLDEPLANISYHVADLAGRRRDSKFIDAPILELADTQPRRGAVEHFYSLTKIATK